MTGPSDAGLHEPTPASFRAAFGAWLQANWDPDLSLVQWRTRLVEGRWAAPSWPLRWHGRGLPRWSDEIVIEELIERGAAGLAVGAGPDLAAPTILACGPDSLRARFLRPILTGEETWCQLFSEPGAGSDLAAVTTRAELDGDHWVVNGQKVWNTSAHHAHFGMLLVRTNWDVPKHRGMTYLVLPMRQPGVEVRPMRQMNDHSSFNEVFMSDAIVPPGFVVGTLGDGWSAALTTLAFERQIPETTRATYGRGAGRAVSEAQREADERAETYKWYPQRFGRIDLVVDHARAAGRTHDPVVRQELAKLLSLQRIVDWTSDRSRAPGSDGIPGATGSIRKLLGSHLTRQAARVHSMLGGMSGQLAGADGAYGGVIAEVTLSVPAQSIAGGTDEVQRNIIGEKVLGLPREPSPDKDLPFRTVRHE